MEDKHVKDFFPKSKHQLKPPVFKTSSYLSTDLNIIQVLFSDVG